VVKRSTLEESGEIPRATRINRSLLGGKRTQQDAYTLAETERAFARRATEFERKRRGRD